MQVVCQQEASLVEHQHREQPDSHIYTHTQEYLHAHTL